MWHIWTLDDWEKNIDLEGKKYADNNLVCFRIYIYFFLCFIDR